MWTKIAALVIATAAVDPVVVGDDGPLLDMGDNPDAQIEICGGHPFRLSLMKGPDGRLKFLWACKSKQQFAISLSHADHFIAQDNIFQADPSDAGKKLHLFPNCEGCSFDEDGNRINKPSQSE